MLLDARISDVSRNAKSTVRLKAKMFSSQKVRPPAGSWLKRERPSSNSSVVIGATLGEMAIVLEIECPSGGGLVDMPPKLYRVGIEAYRAST